MKLVHCACLAAAFALSAIPATAQTDPSDPAVEEQGLDEFGNEADADSAQVRQQRTYVKRETATLRALDKITGRSTDFEIRVDEPVIYGSLKVDLDVCYQTPPEEPPESAAFLKVETTTAIRMNSMAVPRLAKDVEGVDPDGVDAQAIAAQSAGAGRSNDGQRPEEELLFSGWMFSSSPGLSALEHPVYDVWVIRCTDRSPVSRSGPGNPAQ